MDVKPEIPEKGILPNAFKFKYDWTDTFFFDHIVPTEKYKKPSSAQRIETCENLIDFFKGDKRMYNGFEHDYLMALLCMKCPSPYSSEDLFQKIFTDDHDQIPSSKKSPKSKVQHKDFLETPGDINSFWRHLKHDVTLLDSNSHLASKAELAHTIVGLYCMYGLALMTRGAYSLWKAMGSTLHFIVPSLLGTKLDFTCQPIDIKTMKSLKSFCELSDRIKCSMLANIIARYFIEIKSDNPRKEVTRLLSETCLMHNEYHGMNTFKYGTTVARYFRIPLSKLFDAVTTTKTVKSINDSTELLEYANKFCHVHHSIWGSWEINQQITWKWARIFNNLQFQHMQARYHVNLIIRFLAILAYYQGKEHVMENEFLKPTFHKMIFIEECRRAKRIVEAYGSKKVFSE